MEKLSDASFGARLGAFFVDIVVINGLSLVASFVLLAIISPLGDRPSDPVDWMSPQAAGAVMLGMIGLPLAYVGASWSRLLGHRSIGKRLFGLRVVRVRE